MPMTVPQTRPAARRGDAERNRAKILTAARAAFADPRADISMAEISRLAGVGMATLYRNFPGRRELLEALYTEEVDAICAAAAEPADSPGEALTAWLRRLCAFFAAKRHIAAELLKHTDSKNPVFGSNRGRVLAAGQPLLAAAQQAGQVRADLTIDQVLDLFHAVATVEGEAAYVQPIVQAALDGLAGPG
jgi:AcrR family transcriptional regulator